MGRRSSSASCTSLLRPEGTSPASAGGCSGSGTPIMATTLNSFDAGHTDMIHDVQLDYYGRRLATASSDRSVKVFDIAGDQVRASAHLLMKS